MRTYPTTLMAAAFALLLLLNTAFSLAAEIPAPPQSKPIALVGGTIHTVSGGIIENGTVLFDKGKIVAVGTDVTIPEGAEVITITGKHVYPGMIDAATNIGLVEIGSVRATRDVSETGSINPNIRAEAAVNPESEIIPVTRSNGVTLAATYPGGGTISGSAAVIALDGWTWEEMTVKAPAGMVVNWPSMTTNRAWWERRTEEEQKKAREQALDEIRNAFRDARAYLAAKRAENNSGVPFHNTDLRWEALAPVLDGAIPVLVNAEEVQQIQAAAAWAEQEKVKIVIVGGYDAWQAAHLLKAKNIPVIINPIQRTPWRRGEAYDTPFILPKKLHEAGVPFCIAGGGTENERNLPYHAAMAASYGLPKEEALKSVTLYPAQILGIADRVGSIEQGKDATLIVTTGDPLEIMTSVELEFIEGKNIPLTNKQTALYHKYEEKYRRLQKK